MPTVNASGSVVTVFTGGTVFTGHGRRSAPACVAVREGRIAAIGTREDALAAAGPDAAVVDLAGGLLMPGFQDAHAHPVFAGVSLRQCDLHDLDTAQAYLDHIERYARTHPEVEWITGGGWAMDVFPGGRPTRQALDAIVPDRPVFLPNRDAHGSWVNSRALALAGIGTQTPDPPDGRIERDADGEPTGLLHEGAATLVTRLIPPVSASDMDAGLLAAQEYLFSLGITAWQDAIVGSYHGFPDPFDTYLRAGTANTLRARVIGALWWDRDRGAEQISDLMERREQGRAGRFAATTVKIMLDGIAENYTAAMTVPYRDPHGHTSANAGISFIDPVALRAYVTALDAAGFQVHFHALGDRAVREALDAIQAARDTNGPNSHRHHLAHLQVVQPEDVVRFAALDAIATMQPLWACHEPQMDELTIPFLGEGLADRQYPFGDLVRAGARLAAGSDWPVTSPNPLWGAHVAVNRVQPRHPSMPPFLAAQALDLATVLTAYTAGSSYVNHLDADTGTIEVGKHADLTVLDRDPFDHPVEEIEFTQAVQTYVEGELVYSRR
jgi:predicted amidohydrolase YtcJ